MREKLFSISELILKECFSWIFVVGYPSISLNTYNFQKNLILKFVFDYNLTDQIKMEIDRFKNIVDSVFTGKVFVLLGTASFTQWQLVGCASSIVGTELYLGRNFSFYSPLLTKQEINAYMHTQSYYVLARFSRFANSEWFCTLFCP